MAHNRLSRMCTMHSANVKTTKSMFRRKRCAEWLRTQLLWILGMEEEPGWQGQIWRELEVKS